MCRSVAIAGAILLNCPTVLWAHGTRAQPGTWWWAWNGDPLVLFGLGLLGWLYCRGLGRLWARVGVGQKVRRWQAASYLGGLFVIFIALLSPLDALSDELSSLHMIQHMLLMTVAAPLLVLGSPTLVLAWGIPEMLAGKDGVPGSRLREFVRGAFRIPNAAFLWQPLWPWGLFAMTLFAWHHPVLYQAALRDPLLHDVEHLSFFVVAWLFWRAVVDPLAARRMCPAVAIPYLFATSVHASALGVFLALSPRVWYDDYATRTAVWGLTPLEDQQLAGLIMWMPACLVFPAVAAILFGVWLARTETVTPHGRRRRHALATNGG